MDTGKLHKLRELYDRRKDLEDQAAAVKTEEDRLNAEIVEDFIADGVNSVNADGRTFYLNQQLWASGKGNTALAVAALLKEGMTDCLGLGTQRLSGLIREMGEEEFFKTYPELQGVIGTETRSSVRIRKS